MTHSDTHSSHARPVIENLETRRMLDASSVEAFGRTTVGFQFDADGSRVNSDVITINFTDEIRVIDGFVNGQDDNFINVIGYGVNPISGRQRKILTRIEDLRVNPENNTQLQIITGTIVDQLSRVYIYGNAVTDAAGNNIEVLPGEEDIVTPTGASKWRFTLAQRQFRPFVEDYFSQDTYAGSAAPLAGDTFDEAGYRAQLEFILRTRRDNQGTVNDDDIAAALLQYDDAFAKAVIPDDAVRAGLLSNYGTVGEPAIDAILGSNNITGQNFSFVGFDSSTSPDAPVAETRQFNGRLVTRIQPTFEPEFFTVWGAVLAHEAMHQDFSNTQTEEVIANAVETFVWFQQLETYDIAGRTQTELVKTMNSRLLAMLNSGNLQFPRVGLTNAPLIDGQDVFLGGSGYAENDPTSFVDDVFGEYAARGFETGEPPLNNYARDVVELITGVSRNEFGTNLFSQTLIDLIDLRQGVIGDPGAVRVAGSLRLVFFPV